MKSDTIAIMLFLLAVIIIVFLLYNVINRPQKIKIYNEIPPNEVYSKSWGYHWKPYWRKFAGVPGFGHDAPLPEPKMPVPPKPIIIQK